MTIYNFTRLNSNIENRKYTKNCLKQPSERLGSTYSVRRASELWVTLAMFISHTLFKWSNSLRDISLGCSSLCAYTTIKELFKMETKCLFTILLLNSFGLCRVLLKIICLWFQSHVLVNIKHLRFAIKFF